MASHKAGMIKQLQHAVRLGETGDIDQARLISETVYQMAHDYLEDLQAALEDNCQPQSPMATEWIFDAMAGSSQRQTEATLRILMLMMVSQGESSLAAPWCANTDLAKTCAKADAALPAHIERCKLALSAGPA